MLQQINIKSPNSTVQNFFCTTKIRIFRRAVYEDWTRVMIVLIEFLFGHNGWAGVPLSVTLSLEM